MPDPKYYHTKAFKPITLAPARYHPSRLYSLSILVLTTGHGIRKNCISLYASGIMPDPEVEERKLEVTAPPLTRNTLLTFFRCAGIWDLWIYFGTAMVRER